MKEYKWSVLWSWPVCGLGSAAAVSFGSARSAAGGRGSCTSSGG